MATVQFQLRMREAIYQSQVQRIRIDFKVIGSGGLLNGDRIKVNSRGK